MSIEGQTHTSDVGGLEQAAQEMPSAVPDDIEVEARLPEEDEAPAELTEESARPMERPS